MGESIALEFAVVDSFVGLDSKVYQVPQEASS
jgi:hypothetical protein